MEIVLGILFFFLLYKFETLEKPKKDRFESAENEKDIDVSQISNEYIKEEKKDQQLPKSQRTIQNENIERHSPVQVEAINLVGHGVLQRKQEIKDFVKERQIIQLIHFTRYENLEGILNNGLYVRSKLETIPQRFYANDELRLDGHRDSISLSILFPNHRMFYKYRMSLNAKGWVLLAIDPSVLWQYDCAFCKYNAADSRISGIPVNELKHVDKLKEMFAEDINDIGVRKRKRLTVSDPTDVQAEVLVFNNIPKEKIIAVGFENQMLLSECEKKHPDVKLMMANKYFNSRSYVR